MATKIELTTQLVTAEGVINESSDSSDIPPLRDINKHIARKYYDYESEEIVSKYITQQPLNSDSNELLSDNEGYTHSNVKYFATPKSDGHDNWENDHELLVTQSETLANDNASEHELDNKLKMKTTNKFKDETYNTVISIHNELQFRSYIFSETISTLIICDFMAEWCPQSRSCMSGFNALSREYVKHAMFFRICEEEQDEKSNWYSNYKKLASIHELQFYRNGKLLGFRSETNKKMIKDEVRKYLEIESQQRNIIKNPQKQQKQQHNIIINNAQRKEESYPTNPDHDECLLVLSCLACLFCAFGGGWICACYAIRFSNSAQTAYRRGDYNEYRSERINAIICLAIACIFGIFGWTAFILTDGFSD